MFILLFDVIQIKLTFQLQSLNQSSVWRFLLQLALCYRTKAKVSQFRILDHLLHYIDTILKYVIKLYSLMKS